MMAGLSYIHTPATYRCFYQTIPERLALRAKEENKKEIYVFVGPEGQRIGISTSELHEKSVKLAKAFVELGIQKGDKIALCLRNDLDGLLNLFGVIQAGAIVLNVILAREDGSDVKTVLSKVGATALVIHPGFDNSIFRACLNFIDDYDSTGKVECTDIPTLKYFMTTNAVENYNTLTVESLLCRDVKNELPNLDPDDISTMFPTSGSTGEPKFVPMSHFAAMIIGHQLHESIKYDPGDIIYTERRFAWIGGFPFMLLHNGVKVVTKTTALPTMDAHCQFTLDVLAKEKCTHACLLPATIIGLNDLLTNTKSNIQLPLVSGIHTGGLPVASACYKALGTVARRITNCYGSTEAAFVTSLHVTHLKENLNYNTGHPLQGVEVKVLDSEGSVVKRGETGAIHVRTPSLFQGYYKNERKTAEVLSKCRWFNTDDTGFIDSEGNLIVTGRQSDIILQAGKVHYPSLVESFIKQHPNVLDVVVVPVPDEVLFQLVCACIIAKPGTNLTADDMKLFYKSKYLESTNEAFSGFSPRMFLFFDNYPRLYTGKPDKKQLIQEAIRRREMELKSR